MTDNIIHLSRLQYPNPTKSIVFQTQVNLERARLDLEHCVVLAHIDLKEKAVIDLTVSTWGSDYTSYLTTGQVKDLESEALYHAGLLQ